MCLYRGIQVHSSYLHHGAAGHSRRAWPLRASTQLDRVVHHHIPFEQDGGGHERVTLHEDTQELFTSYKDIKVMAELYRQSERKHPHCLS